MRLQCAEGGMSAEVSTTRRRELSAPSTAVQALHAYSLSRSQIRYDIDVTSFSV